MFKNYYRIALRTLWKNKKLTAINVVGLASGLACSLLIFLYVQYETGYDKFNENGDRIYRVVKDFINDDGSRIPDATTPGPLAFAMQENLAEVESITRLHPDWGGTIRVSYEEKAFSEPKVWRVDSSFFDVFTVRFLKGSPKTALSDINSVVITESTAKRYFGETEPIGKILTMNGKDHVTVTGLINDVPAQSHFHYDFLLSYRRLPPSANTNWNSYNYYTYVKVKPGTDVASFEEKIQKLYEKSIVEDYSDFYVQPLLKIHLTSKLKWELEANGDQLYVYIFMIIGGFIVIIAAINYINLSTAKSSLRAKETGIRKVSGARRQSLVIQFLLESVILTILSAVFALVIAYLLIPVLNELTQKQLSLTSDLKIYLWFVLVTLAIGLIAGLFPAMYLSSFQPVAVLKGFKLQERRALSLRKGLVIVQFTISITLIIGALVIFSQVNYIQSANLGFSKDRVLVIRNAGGLSKSNRNSFLNTIKAMSGVEQAATSSTVLGQGFNTTRLRAKGSQLQQQLNFTSAGFDFLDVVGIKIKEGRGFSREFLSDTVNNGIPGGPLEQRLGGIVLNERAVKEFGLDSPAVGKQLVWSTDGDTTYYVEVIGVAKDFHFTSLRNEIKPYGFLMFPRGQNNFTVKLSGGNITSTIAQLESQWKQSFPEVPFEYSFLDDSFAKMYEAEQRFEKLFISLVVLGIIISCLGLFALAAFSAEQRVKEIGIRKVLGASVGQIVMLISKDFVKLVMIAVVLSVPIGLYGLQVWLEGFAYRISLAWWFFAAGAVIAFVIAMLTVSSQAMKAAMTDPAKSLRNE
jgi:putative ABC transport system permease protein